MRLVQDDLSTKSSSYEYLIQYEVKILFLIQRPSPLPRFMLTIDPRMLNKF